MKKYYAILFGILFSITLVTAQSFEGVVYFKSTAGTGESGDFKYYGKDNKIKMEMMSDEMGSVIFDGSKTIILMPAQKSYMEFSNEMLEQLGGMSQDADEDMGEVNLPTKTNETKNILGYDCTKWVYKEDHNETELWITDQIGNYIIPSTPMTPAPEWADLFDGKPFFPLMIITKENGSVVDKMEVTKIEKKSLSESEFQPPAGFKKMDLGNMMGQ